jgi:endonuclease YncB( thermonuclease family)
VWTREQSALGRSALGRVYGIVITDKGKDLNRLLVANGLARIYGVKTTLHDGRDSKPYVASLKALEQQAKKARVGGWRFRRGS